MYARLITGDENNVNRNKSWNRKDKVALTTNKADIH